MVRRTHGTGEAPPTPEVTYTKDDLAANSNRASFADEALLSFVERWERLDEEKKAIGDDQKEVMTEAKGTGFDPKIIRQVIRLRKMDPNDRAEQSAMLDLYAEAIKRAQAKAFASSVAAGGEKPA